MKPLPGRFITISILFIESDRKMVAIQHTNIPDTTGIQEAKGADGKVSELIEDVERKPWEVYWGWDSFINYNLNSESGDTTKQIVSNIPEQAVIRSANGFLSGSAHNGTLKNFAGTSVSAASIEYALEGDPVPEAPQVISASNGESAKAFIIDFGGIRKIKSLVVTQTTPKLPNIVMVLPWMGIEFGSSPLFPYSENLIMATDGGSGSINFPEVETAKLFVQFDSPVPGPHEADLSRTDQVLENLAVISNTMPLNTRVAVGNRPPFHTFAGELKTKSPLPEFSGELNAYLDELKKAGAKDVPHFPLMITMDAPGTVDTSDFNIVYDLEAKALWGENTRHTLTFERPGTKQVPLTFTESGSKAWQLQGINFDVLFDAPPWRTFPRDFPEISDSILATVTSDLNIAQCLSITETTKLHGFGIYLSARDQENELLIEMVADEGGLPGDTPVYEQSLVIKSDESAGWFDIFFTKPLAVTAGKNLWIVMKSKLGSLSIALDPKAPEKQVLFNRNGTGFKTFPFKNGALSMAFLLYRRPAAGETADAVSFKAGGQDKTSDLPEETNPIRFSWYDDQTGESSGPRISPGSGSVVTDLEITAHTAGSITIQDVTARYQHTS